ncbi:endonuclease/exonuclease/phosphatase family protein [Rathayibacter iranicus]|uniref:Endonuclease/exonuclease/phosphatase (EEP) superfamily protein YafD n=1 Tax=Rathayibacter iranicus NCPPB 2253 = VKM Ac-1602 TaxID=1328868 RepID=A0ABX5LGT6_9MICO|nr:endonuclease/exonuclease/phosphatase family protein [Rathayibacter iranicus]MWV30371.1 endonuclease/exonuclease/phosphatase family protein [Rathayibacter iranicus NCPPB 2253 = VKM Ac-1602]PWJ64280.1 endonuclease/exonuclease/phosphatase (EEP) superfamily protein YafD [Rathayibacter iranicus NCPPB 2253 = VKM Ac-1602]
MATRLVKFAVALAVAIMLLVLVVPGFFGVAREAPFAQIVPFRLATGLAAVAAAAVLVVLAVLVAPIRRLSLALAALGVAFALVLAGVQGLRGYGSAPPRAHRLADVRVASWNILHDGVPTETIVELAQENAVDAVALLEVSRSRAQEVADALSVAGAPMTLHYAGAGGTDGSALLLSPGLGGYSIDSGTVITGETPSLIARPDTPERPVLAAVHTMAPIPGGMAQWRSDLAGLARLCTAEEDVIVVGDLNSTAEHWADLPGTAALGGCEDAGARAGGGALGTWPASIPPALGAPIDYVLFSGRWEVSGYLVVTDRDEAGSDHRPLVVQLSVRGLVKDSS